MTDSAVDIVSMALARLGEPAISSMEEDTDTADKVRLLYEPTILGLLGSYEWSFARTRALLVEDGAANPVNEWRRAFLLPALKTDRVGKPIAMYNSQAVGARKIFSYELEERWAYTNETLLVCEYIQRKSEALWPGPFIELAVEAVAAKLALPITEIASKEAMHLENAFGPSSAQGRGGLYGKAVAADQQGDPTETLLDDADPITAARFGGY